MGQIVDVIKYEGDNSTFIWKHPAEDFNIMSQLIVHESQQAVFFLNGEALDVFGPGRHTLETQNLPLVGKALNRLTGDQSPFHCEVYFINQTVQMAVKWGTDSKVRYVDPEYGIPMEIGASGEMNLKVSDGLKLLIKLVGTMKGIAWGENGTQFTQSLQNSFRPLISMAVKTNLSASIKEKNIPILEVDEHLDELGDVLKEKILPGFEEYGLTIPQFYLTTVVLPEDDPNFKRIRELHTVSLQVRMAKAEAEVKSAQALAEADVTAAQRQIELERQTTETEVAKREAERKVIGAQAEAEALKVEGFAEAEVMRAKGYTQKDVMQADVQKAYAEGLGNMGGSGGGSTMGDIVGLGVGLKAATMIGSQVGNMFDPNMSSGNTAPAAPEQTVDCPKCGNKLPAGAKFCLECGSKIEILDANEILCPSCGEKTPKGKFCMKCGTPLVNKCPNCGADVPLGGKFCLECGTQL